MPSRTSYPISRRWRSSREWVGRIALACGIAVLGYQSIAFSVAQVAARAQPKDADAHISYDGRLTAAHAAALITPGISTADRAQADVLSRAALSHDPTAVTAAATLGIVTLAQNNTQDASRLLAYAQILSRRNVQTQLWSIEDAVKRGDVSGALRWYDIALRTKPSLRDVLYPVLAQASHARTVRAALVNTLAGKPAWLDSYVNFAAVQKDNPESTAALFIALQARGVSIPSSAQAPVVNLLLDAGNVDQAWHYYTVIHPKAVRTRSRDPNFTAMIDTPSLFDWVTRGDDSIAASIQRTRDGGTFNFSAPASIGGPVLQQVQLLPAGTYRLIGHSDGIAQDARALPYWMLTCRDDGRELGRVATSNSAQARGVFTGDFTVPPDCQVQTLALFVQASDIVGGASGQIDRVALEPVG